MSSVSTITLGSGAILLAEKNGCLGNSSLPQNLQDQGGNGCQLQVPFNSAESFILKAPEVPLDVVQVENQHFLKQKDIFNHHQLGLRLSRLAVYIRFS